MRVEKRAYMLDGQRLVYAFEKALEVELRERHLAKWIPKDDKQLNKLIEDATVSMLHTRLLKRVNRSVFEYRDYYYALAKVLVRLGINPDNHVKYPGTPDNDEYTTVENILALVAEPIFQTFLDLSPTLPESISDEWDEWIVEGNLLTPILVNVGDYRIRRYTELLKDGTITQ